MIKHLLMKMKYIIIEYILIKDVENDIVEELRNIQAYNKCC